VAIIALAFWPDVSCRLLVACLVHDLQEGQTGDMPHTVKRDFPDLNTALVSAERAAIEVLGLHHVMDTLTEAERERLKVADVVDAWHYGYDEWRSGNLHGATIMQNAMLAIARYPNAGVPYWWSHAAQSVVASLGGSR
jgi:5'-deoxynucleotidase YfbR-like HD superfamily hydrolase